MKKAFRLLTMCIITTLLLAVLAVSAAAEDAAPEDVPSTVDVPAEQPAGVTYAVGTGSADSQAVTVVDMTLDGGGETECAARFSGDSRYYYGLQTAGTEYGVVIDGAVSGYFGSSAGTIPLYGPQGAVSGVVWGECRNTSVDCGVGFLVSGGVSQGVLVEDGACFTCREAVILCPSGSGSFRFVNARLSSDSGVLAETQPGAGELAVSYGNGSYAGDHINGGSAALSVTVESGALLFGDTVQTGGPIRVTVAAGGAWIVDQGAQIASLNVEEGGVVYGALERSEDGSLALQPSDSVLEAGIYEAQPLSQSLGFGHGPAEPATDDAEGSPAEPADETPAPDAEDNAFAGSMFPLVPNSGKDDPAPEEDAPAPTPEAAELVPETDNDAPAPEEDAPAPDAGSDRAGKLFPLVPTTAPEDEAEEEPESAPAEEPETEPAEEPAPDEDIADSSEIEIETASAALPGEDDSRQLGRGLCSGVAFARRPGALASASPVAPSMELAARLASVVPERPAVATLLKTGAKSRSFLPEALDNRALILYNPYCCSAA